MSNEFGKRLKQARKLRKLTQVKLGELMGIPQSTISSAEILGAASTITAQYAAALSVNPHWLATGEGNMQDEVLHSTQRPITAQNPSYLAGNLGKLLDTIKDENEKNTMYSICVLLLTKNPLILAKFGLLPEQNTANPKDA